MPDRRTRSSPGPYAALGRRVRALREQARLSQRELSRRINMSETYVAKIEAGQEDWRPTPETLRLIVHHLSDVGADYDELAGLAGYVTPQEREGGAVPVYFAEADVDYGRWFAGLPRHLKDLIQQMARPLVRRADEAGYQVFTWLEDTTLPSPSAQQPGDDVQDERPDDAGQGKESTGAGE